jgi:predicted regulator of Ras-like GTPase activity (Roadblock/LC7/MglB family)
MDRLLYLEVSEERMEAIRKIVIEVLRDSGAKCGLLIDVTGHLLIRKGFTLIREIENLCVLIAAQRATTREIARVLGQEEISVIYHQGSGDHIHTTDVGSMAIFTLLFDERADLLELQRVVNRRIPDIVALLGEAGHPPGAEPSKIQDLRSQADKSLNEMFGRSGAGGSARATDSSEA